MIQKLCNLLFNFCSQNREQLTCTCIVYVILIYVHKNESSQNKLHKIENEIHWKYGLNVCHLTFGWQNWKYTKPESTKSGTDCSNRRIMLFFKLKYLTRYNRFDCSRANNKGFTLREDNSKKDWLFY